MGLPCVWLAKAQQRGRAGGGAVSICGRCRAAGLLRSAARAVGAVPAWLAQPAAAESVRGPVTVRAVPGPCGQAIINRLSLQPL